MVITAAYILWTLQRVYLGTNPAYKDYPDITLRELSVHHARWWSWRCSSASLPFLVLTWMEPHVTGLVDSLVQIVDERDRLRLRRSE